jgi:hypothetical protein
MVIFLVDSPSMRSPTTETAVSNSCAAEVRLLTASLQQGDQSGRLDAESV